MKTDQVIQAVRDSGGIVFTDNSVSFNLISKVQSMIEAAIAHERSKAPAWHDAPTVPGLWLNPVSKNAISVTQYAIEKSIWANCGDCWFGPIPEDAIRRGEQ